MASRAVVTMSRAITSWHVAVRWVSFALAIAEAKLSATTDDLLNSSSLRTCRGQPAILFFHGDPVHTSTVRMNHTSGECWWSLLYLQISYLSYFPRIILSKFPSSQYNNDFCANFGWGLLHWGLDVCCTSRVISFMCRFLSRPVRILCMFGGVCGGGFESKNTTK